MNAEHPSNWNWSTGRGEVNRERESSTSRGIAQNKILSEYSEIDSNRNNDGFNRATNKDDSLTFVKNFKPIPIVLKKGIEFRLWLSEFLNVANMYREFMEVFDLENLILIPESQAARRGQARMLLCTWLDMEHQKIIVHTECLTECLKKIVTFYKPNFKGNYGPITEIHNLVYNPLKDKDNN